MRRRAAIIDLVVHLSATISMNMIAAIIRDAGEALAGRVIEPSGRDDHPLADYRLRFASYRADPDLAAPACRSSR